MGNYLYCCIQYAVTAAVFLCRTTAVSNENDEVFITEDLFYTPLNVSDANAMAEAGAKLWPNRTGIPYLFSNDFDDSDKKVVLKALRQMEKKTKECILFKERTDERDYLYFALTDDGECRFLPGPGRLYGGQEIALGGKNYSSLFRRCFSTSDIQQLVMRSLGFDWEHLRPDRDCYVDIIPTSIAAEDDYNSDFQINSTIYTFGTKYDYHSVLHFPAFYDAISRKSPSIVPKQGLIVRMGQSGLSPTDIARIKIAYKCPLKIHPAAKTKKTQEDFPKFSMEQMTEDECGAQFNRYCKPYVATTADCADWNHFQIECQSNVSVAVLEHMALEMADPPLKPVSVYVSEEVIAKYSFSPVQIQVVMLFLRSCATNRVTSRLVQLNFTNLLNLEFSRCNRLTIEKGDFETTRHLRIILFYRSTIDSLEPGTFTDLPHLEIVSLESQFRIHKTYNFDPPFRNFLRRLHCDCEFAWYRSWWRNNKKLRAKVETGQLYSFEARYTNTRLENDEYTYEDVYHPINCNADPFPLGPEWISYYTQAEYSINEPNCTDAATNGTLNEVTSKSLQATTSA
ncbi:uncharacterized protein LOC129589602 [Paramacrobiotus metropolitanus]|uniref:uncharacterized protein LOC129589602 n=1 Tax=Paramacrobiotus metropolitanus TaxID=2943436 RepID=UPI00244652A1|nr:uncharacterized protein LOC129589602 [Paramacrobiotus metropolitanus]